MSWPRLPAVDDPIPGVDDDDYRFDAAREAWVAYDYDEEVEE